MRADHDPLLPTTQRAVPLCARRDLVTRRVQYQGVEHWIVKDPAALRYYRLQAEQYYLLRLLDGRRSLEALRDEFQRAFRTLRPTLAAIQQLIADFHHKGLVYSQRPGQGAALERLRRQRRRRQLWAALRNVLYIRLPGWDAEPALRSLYPAVRWMFRPWVVALTVLCVLSSWCLLLVQFGEVERRLPEFHQFFSWPNVLYLWLTLGAVKIVHELAHGLACRHYDGECHEIGLAFLVFSPCLYCDVSDSWVLRSKWSRIAIAAAGMYIEVAVSALAIFAWWFTRPGLVNHLCLNVFFVSAITTVIFNANPLLRFDGYYMLADWLEIPNLRAKADRLLRQGLARACLGIRLAPAPFMPWGRQGWLSLYALAAMVYRWCMVFGIVFFLHRLLEPYGLASVAKALAAVSVMSLVGGIVYSTYQTLVAPRTEPMNVRRPIVCAAVLVAVLAAALCAPLPRYVEYPFVIEPAGIEHVYSSTPGRLAAVHVRPGQRVARGQVLLELASPSERLQQQQLETARAQQEIDVATHRTLGDADGERVSLQSLTTLNELSRDQAERLRRLTIVAPCDGVVVAPESVPPPSADVSRTSLAAWHGTPLDAANLGCFIEAQSHLLSIVPGEGYENAGYEAVLWIDQTDRNDAQLGQSVRLKFNHLPSETYEGTIASFSERETSLVPKAISNKYGGDLPTMTDGAGREQLTSVAYQAIVPMDGDAHLLRPGLRGCARSVMASRTAAECIWRYLRRTFHFRL